MSIVGTVTRQRALQRATGFAQVAACLIESKGDYENAERLFSRRHPSSPYREGVKSAVAVGNTSDSVWAGPVAPLRQLSEGFVEFLRPNTIVGRMTGFRRLPLNVRTPRATAGSSATWIGEGKPVAATRMSFDAVTFKAAKVAGLVALTKEVVASSDPDSIAIVRDDLTAAIAQLVDTSFLDASITEIANVRPAAVTNGAPTVASTGTTAAAFAADFKALLALVTSNLTAPFLIMKPKVAVALSALDSHLTRNVGANGGSIGGIAVITSANVPTDGNSPSGDIMVLVDAAEIFLSEGAVELDASIKATVELNTEPSDPVSVGTVAASLWQHDLVGVKAMRFVNFKRRRDGAVAVLTGVNY